MMILQQSEATAARRRIPVYLVDATDGFTEETGLAGSATVTVSKNGGAFGGSAGSFTEIGNGYYYYEATAGELDTLGMLGIRVTDAASRNFAGLAQVVAYDPYADFTTSVSDILTDTAAMQPTVATNLDATVSSRSTLAQADILSDATPFDGADVAAILSDTNAVLVDTAAMQPTVATNLNATVSSRSSHSAADVDVTLSSAHGAGAWNTGLSVAQNTALIEVWQRLGLDSSNAAVHRTATEAVDGYVHVPVGGATIELVISRTGEIVTVTRQ
jgi:hypothetical protein